MKKTEEKYLRQKIDLIRAVITGVVMGSHMFPIQDKRMGDAVKNITDSAMNLIEKDVRNIFNYAKKLS